MQKIVMWVDVKIDTVFVDRLNMYYWRKTSFFYVRQCYLRLIQTKYMLECIFVLLQCLFFLRQDFLYSLDWFGSPNSSVSVP